MNRNIYAAAMVSALALSSTVNAQSIRGITTDDKLFTIENIGTPALTTTPVTITGLATGQSIVGIDYRPNTGELYALAFNTTTSLGQLYTINTTTAAATAVGAPMTLALGTGSVGFDFNPTVDRIRVIGANQKNYRLHPTTGAIVFTDGELAYATGDIHAGTPPSIGASAYTNSYIGSEATTLLNYDEGLNVITTQVPPNNGTQNTVGASGITVNTTDKSTGMDIYFDKATNTNTAYLNANTLTGNDQLYTVNLTNGAATALGPIGLGLAVKDIAVTIDRTLPAVTGQMVYALTKTNSNFISFDSENPNFIRTLTAITGVTTGQRIVGMDFRPANRQLYALGYDATNSNYQLYTLNTETGVATAVNATAGQINLGTTGNVGFDFNPVPDRIRVVSATTRANYRLHPETGAIAATDSSLNFTAGDANESAMPYIGSVAYTNSYAGATATTLYGVDDSTGLFVSINPPNDGKLNTIAANFVTVNTADVTFDMDMYYDSTSATNIGYLAANTGSGVNDDLYTFTPLGTTTVVGSIGYGIPISDIAVKVDYTNTPVPNGIGNVNRNLPGMKVYPNPVGAILKFAVTNGLRQVQVTVMDLTGRVMMRETLKDNSLNVSALTAGTYMVQVVADGQAYAPAKFVKR